MPKQPDPPQRGQTTLMTHALVEAVDLSYAVVAQDARQPHCLSHFQAALPEFVAPQPPEYRDTSAEFGMAPCDQSFAFDAHGCLRFIHPRIQLCCNKTSSLLPLLAQRATDRKGRRIQQHRIHIPQGTNGHAPCTELGTP